MAQHHEDEGTREPVQGGRGSDRRGNERRRVERRAPVPPWRQPWALVGYGVLGALALVLLLNGLGGDDDPSGARDEKLVSRTPELTPTVVDSTQGVAGAQDAYGHAGFERLVVEGAASKGRLVRTELYCEAPKNYTVVRGDTVDRAVADLIDDGHVPAAECKWGPSGEAKREDFLLLVPPARAAEFAATPVTRDAYVERHRVIATVEWVGRSEALALRTAGVFRGRVR